MLKGKVQKRGKKSKEPSTPILSHASLIVTSYTAIFLIIYESVC